MEDLDRQAAMPAFWDDPAAAQRILKEKGVVERVVRDWKEVSRLRDDVATLLELAEELEDDDAAAESREKLEQLEAEVRALETRRLLSEEHDALDAIVEFNPGAGGVDAADWAQMLLRMVTRWAERRGFATELLDHSDGEEAGIRAATIAVRGPYAYGYLQSEIGVHRLVRISPFDQAARRHTAFAAIFAYPEIDDTIEVEINPADVRMETMRAGGAGGQHVNTTDSAVRLIHEPTGIAVKCSAERSQHKNRDKALKMLKARLYQLELDKRLEAQSEANAQKKRIDFGSQIRSYVLQPYQQVKDLRTGEVSSAIDRVLDGELDPFMESWLAARAEGELEASG
ncbi:MAG: peptide chain release factor 2 [Deltaproteobacteria bacterium]|nr:MAG: peptide chain release factor 2 [Deltaproteobacteria bacterium]